MQNNVYKIERSLFLSCIANAANQTPKTKKKKKYTHSNPEPTQRHTDTKSQYLPTQSLTQPDRKIVGNQNGLGTEHNGVFPLVTRHNDSNVYK